MIDPVIPREVTAVRGCTCTGSLEMHRIDCAVHDLTEDEYQQVVDEARARLKDYVSRYFTDEHRSC
jgi:hypothetical protein